MDENKGTTMRLRKKKIIPPASTPAPKPAAREHHRHEVEPACCTDPETASEVQHMSTTKLYENLGPHWQETGDWQYGRCANGWEGWHWKLYPEPYRSMSAMERYLYNSRKGRYADVRNDRTEWTASVLPGSLPGDSTDTSDTSTHELEPAEKKLVGLQAAADYCGMKYDAFEQARKRYKRKHGHTIPGEFMWYGQPAWYAADLDAWMASRPRAHRS